MPMIRTLGFILVGRAGSWMKTDQTDGQGLISDAVEMKVLLQSRERRWQPVFRQKQ